MCNEEMEKMNLQWVVVISRGFLPPLFSGPEFSYDLFILIFIYVYVYAYEYVYVAACLYM